MKILLVEDHPDILELYQEMLDELGHTYKAFSNAVGIEETISSYKPDLLMLDIILPVRDGMELMTDLLRKDIRLPILVISSSREYAETGVFFGASHYLLKPFSTDSLGYAIDDCIKNYQDIKRGTKNEL